MSSLIETEISKWKNSSEFDGLYNQLKRMLNELNENERIIISKMIEETDFLYAPGSTKFHGAYFGGLLNHVVSVYNLLISNSFNKISNSMCVKFAILHDFCKVDYYIPTITLGESRDMTKDELEEDRSKNPKSKKFKIRDEKISFVSDDKYMLGHAETSIVKCLEYGIPLTKDEMICIRWHMGNYDYFYSYKVYDEKLKKVLPIYRIFQYCDDFSSILEK